jgi:TrpR-related protein YerC/YecD
MDERKLRSPETDLLMQAILHLETVDDAYAFFEDLCTIAEIKSMTQRLNVAALLRSGMKYQEIAGATGASTATISRVSRCLSYGADGYVQILEKLEAQGLLPGGENGQGRD